MRKMKKNKELQRDVIAHIKAGGDSKGKTLKDIVAAHEAKAKSPTVHKKFAPEHTITQKGLDKAMR